LLSEKLDRVETRIDRVESTLIKRIDALGADLYSLRARYRGASWDVTGEGKLKLRDKG